jgi:hypothetical protein
MEEGAAIAYPGNCPPANTSGCQELKTGVSDDPKNPGKIPQKATVYRNLLNNALSADPNFNDAKTQSPGGCSCVTVRSDASDSLAKWALLAGIAGIGAFRRRKGFIGIEMNKPE